MGVVYQASDPYLGRIVAIKTIYSAEAVTPQQQEEIKQLSVRLFREANAAGILSDPNIVTIFDIAEDAGGAYIVMEFVDGQNLEDMAVKATSPLPVEKILKILGDAAGALDSAHAKGIIHRDVKPANIMVRNDGMVKLADFGIAKLPNAERITPAGSAIGTPHFLSPEMLKAEPLSGRSDQFSFAVSTYQILTGRMPFTAENLAAILTKILTEHPPPSGLNEAADNVLRKALSKDPANRFDSCRAFVSALKTALIHREDEPTATMISVLWPGVAAPPKARQTRVNPKDGLTYVYIPPGSFHMGCSPGDKEAIENEKPGRLVTLTKGFWMAESPITQAAYQQVMGKNPSHFKGPNRPVETVTWFEAVEYCSKAGGRLPTETEWEYAARGGSPAARYGELDDVAWYDGNSGGSTHDVKEKLANDYGLFDMLGNVWEWTGDWYMGKLGGSAVTDPTGPPKGDSKVLRGGSWYSIPRCIRAWDRDGGGPAGRGSGFGFRCVGD